MGYTEAPKDFDHFDNMVTSRLKIVEGYVRIAFIVYKIQLSRYR